MDFPRLAGRVAEVKSRIAAAVERGGRGQEVRIVAVTKTFGVEAVRAARDAGLGLVGENKVQEALSKMDEAPAVEWHLIGHLQRNKVRHLDRFALFHALDSLRLAEAIHAWAGGAGRRARVLVQVNVAGEATKGGFAPGEVQAAARRLRELEGIAVAGAMTMAPFEAGDAVLRATFAGCRASFERLRDAGLPATELSMGMSGDYEVAVEEGATLVRLGTILFGERGAP
jgi:pyridoxal phosphate enzyme (YggS family)